MWARLGPPFTIHKFQVVPSKTEKVAESICPAEIVCSAICNIVLCCIRGNFMVNNMISKQHKLVIIDFLATTLDHFSCRMVCIYDWFPQETLLPSNQFFLCLVYNKWRIDVMPCPHAAISQVHSPTVEQIINIGFCCLETGMKLYVICE